MIKGQCFGTFNKESDGRLSGHMIAVQSVRRDGKVAVTHIFGSGARIGKVYSAEQLAAEIAKL